jgi:UDP-4-amino-4,6-dideoxy-N-acetyl-beta-L-altrosamine transaminase
MIPYGKQDISQEDIDAVISVLKSDFLTQGPLVPAFEKKVLENCKAKYAVASTSATASLHLACMALNISNNDIVWTSPISFVASSNCALYCGATVDFVDIDLKTNNMCVVEIEKKLIIAKNNNKLPKAVIPVHMGGLSCDMEMIFNLSKKYGFKIIEDASHAIGATYNNNPVGCCEYSDIAVFSFHPVKIITTGEGGISVTNSKALHSRMELLRSHGITRNQDEMSHASHGDWYYQQIELGFNYRITEIQAALGISQLKRLHNFVDKRNELAKVYDKNLKNLPIDLPANFENIKSSYHLYIIKLQESNLSFKKNLFDFLRKNEIGVNLHYIPIHTHPYYLKLGFNVGDFPKAEIFYANAISIPLYTNLTPKNQMHIINSISEYLS